MAGNFTYSYVFQKNIAYAVSRANFLTYLTAMICINCHVDITSIAL